MHQLSRGKPYYRLCSHYLPLNDKPVGQDYYFGDDYLDYPTQTYPEHALDLLRKFDCGNRLLDVGCALGVYTKAFLDAGFDAYGVDVSPFAIDQASRLVGPVRAKCADLDTQEIPFSGSFETIWMWDVLEHFRTPDTVLEKVSQCALSGTKLILHTSNADSLTRRCLARDWEGYSDYSHQGVDQVTCTSLRQWLDRTGWKIIDFECSEIWTRGVDPVLLRLQEVFRCVPELRVLLAEAELGDFITLVASKR
jgi:2-polyprenyl-3-methyl-5-hydroxy-6-metoxy-1,4-benzoquinol methylase